MSDFNKQSAGQNELNENYILLYSKRCGQSAKFIKTLHEYPHLNACFQKLEIEQLQAQGKLPPQLTYIPGVIDGNQLLMGPNAFEWLKQKSKEHVGHAPSIDNKLGLGGMTFSYVDNANDDYSPGFANYGRETENNGSNIDPNNFDIKSGKPITNHQQINQQTNIASQTSNANLPPQLQPQKIDNSNTKLSDGEMQRYIQSRDNGINIIKRQ